MSTEPQPASGVVDTYFEKKPEENKPHKLIIGQNAFSTFDDETVADVEDGVEVAFEFVTNGQYNNIVDGSLTVKDDDPAPEPDTETDGATAAGGASPTDVRIRRQVALKAAAENEPDGAPVKRVLDRADAYNDWLKGGER